MISRQLEHIIPHECKGFPAVAIVGPRQSGKTTLAKKIFADHRYISLESLDWRERAEHDPRGFLADMGNLVILDEVQRVPGLFSYLQEWLDAGDHHAVLTGSSQFLLQESISQSLAGRIAHFELLPFSWAELSGRSKSNPRDLLEHKFKGIKPTHSTREIMLRGFFPRIHASSLNAHRWLDDYVRTYVERDVRMLTQVTDLSAFTLMMRLLASQVGSLLNTANIATQVGVSLPTIKRWLGVLETSGLLILLKPYHVNFGKRLLKTPKPYFVDTGLLCLLMGIRDASQLELHPLRGHIFENLVVAEFWKSYLNAGERPPLWYWRESNGLEVDLLIENGTQLFPVEIKSSATWRKDHASTVQRFLNLSAPKNPQGLVVYDGDAIHGTKDAIPTAPWWKLW